MPQKQVVCLVPKGSRRARGSTESCLMIPLYLKVEAKQQECVGSFQSPCEKVNFSSLVKPFISAKRKLHVLSMHSFPLFSHEANSPKGFVFFPVPKGKKSLLFLLLSASLQHTFQSYLA